MVLGLDSRQANQVSDLGERKRWIRRLWSAVVYTLAGLGLVVVLVTGTPLVQWSALRLAGPWNDPQGDVLIVLAGSTMDGILGSSSYLRSEYAILAYRQGGFRTVVLSGGGPGSKPESVVMEDFIACQGVPRSSIITETRSNSTRQNALFSRPLLDNLPGRKVLMTSDYHMFRAHRVFAKLGIDVLPRPIPDAGKLGSTWRGRLPAFLEIAQECAKIAYYYLRGWM
jgi:uncharacterized SAM-binding protein YcdF (DUF218 family)